MGSMWARAVVGVIVAVSAGAASGQTAALPHVEVAGTGEVPVVLIHTVQADWRVWDPFMQRHAADFTMYAVRLPGCGGSDPLPLPADDAIGGTPWTDAVVADLAAYLSERGVTGATAIGHGLGGVIALRLAAEAPDTVPDVITVDAMPAYPLSLNEYSMNAEERAAAVREGFAASTEVMDPIQWRVQYKDVAARQTGDPEMSPRLGAMSEQLNFDTWRWWSIEFYTPDLTEAVRAAGTRVLAAAAMNLGMQQVLGSAIMVEEFWRLPFDPLPSGDVTFFESTPHYVFLDRAEAFDAMVARFIAGEPQPAYSYRDPASVEPAP